MSTAHDLPLKDDLANQTIKLLYSTGFRLTGNHQSAALLVKKTLHRLNTELTRPWAPASISGGCPRAARSSIDSTNIQRGLNPPLNEDSFNNNGRLEPVAAVKKLCRVFIEDSTAGLRKQQQTGLVTRGLNNSGPVQGALLKLEPRERTIVILRDTLGLSYAEIAEITSADEKEVARRIAAARWALKKMLTQGGGLDI